MTKIGFIINRIGGIDGVSLETLKWITVLKRLKYNVSILTGKLESQIEDVAITIIPELDFHHSDTLHEQNEIFFNYNIEKSNALNAWIFTKAFLLKCGRPA